MVSVVQLVEHRIVVPSVVGSSPITHPLKALVTRLGSFFLGPIFALVTNSLIVKALGESGCAEYPTRIV